VLRKEDQKIFFVLLAAAILLFVFGFFIGFDPFFIVGEILILIALVRLLLK